MNRTPAGADYHVVAKMASLRWVSYLETSWFDEFYAEGLVSEVVGQLKSGKEATVFICRAGDPAKLVAVKYYRSRLGRGFQNRAAYQHGRVIGDARTARAVANRSRHGLRAAEALWVNHEFDMLCHLRAAGVDVPEPIAATDSAILMECIGDEQRPAVQLRELRPTASEATSLLDRLLWNIERMLANDVVHGDLSAYNILVANGRPVIIDLPQAVDARTNANASKLLSRDIGNVCRHLGRFGAHVEPEPLAKNLWARYRRAELSTDGSRDRQRAAC